MRKTFLTLSLLAALGFTVLWISTAKTKTLSAIYWSRSPVLFSIVFHGGSVSLGLYFGVPAAVPAGWSRREGGSGTFLMDAMDAPWYVVVLPAAYPPTPGSIGLFVDIRLWFLIALSSVYPLILWLIQPLIVQRRRRCSQCVKCSYDLTGNESGICPECGTAVKK